MAQAKEPTKKTRAKLRSQQKKEAPLEQWKSGRKDVDLSQIRPAALRDKIVQQRRDVPALNNIQTINQLAVAGQSHHTLARKFLVAQGVLPWEPVLMKAAPKPAQQSESSKKSSKKQARAKDDAGIAVEALLGKRSISRKRQIQLICFIIPLTRPSRMPIQMTDVRKWAADDHKAFPSLVEDAMDKSQQTPCEDILLQMLEPHQPGSIVVRKFLWSCICKRKDMRVTETQLRRLFKQDTASSREEDSHSETFDEGGSDHAEVIQEDADSEGAHDIDNMSDSDVMKTGTKENPGDKYNGLILEGDSSRDESYLIFRGLSQNGSSDRSTSTSQAPPYHQSFWPKPEDLESRWTSFASAQKQSDARDHVNIVNAPTQLYQLDPKDQEDQGFYFGLYDPADIVRCTRCGVLGHFKTCINDRCEICGDNHTARPCPRVRKCLRCRERGHTDKHCTKPSKAPGGIGDECDLCGNVGHAEEECGRLWTWPQASNEPKRKIPESEMNQRRNCYRCGSRLHWGDDCPNLPEHIRRRVCWHSMFSAKNAARFTYPGNTHDIPEEAPTYGSLPAYQLQQLSNFD